jgi:hypothetical protein
MAQPVPCIGYVELLVSHQANVYQTPSYEAREQRVYQAEQTLPMTTTGRPFVASDDHSSLVTALAQHRQSSSSSSSSSSSLSDDNDECACTDDIVDEAVAEQKLDTENAQIWFQQVLITID